MKTKNIILKILSLSTILLTSGCDVESDNKSITLTGPKDGEIIDIMPKSERSYVDAMYEQAKGIQNDYVINDLNGDNVEIADYYKKYTCGKGVKVKLGCKVKGFGNNRNLVYHVSTENDFSNEVIYETTRTSFELNSLYSNTTYYWKITDKSGIFSSETKSFTMSEGWRGIEGGKAPNIRDMGGHKTKFGKYIKQGLVYRGSEFNKEEYTTLGTLHPKTIDETTINMAENVIKIGTEIDFRGPEESNFIFESNINENIKYDRQIIPSYAELLTGSQGICVKNIFLDFLDATTTSSVYFHCMGGADRTGTIGFLLGGILGMSYTDLVIDYELTSFSYNLREHDKVGQWSNFPAFIETLKTITNANESTPISEMCETWLTSKKCGLTMENINNIRNLMIEK